MNTPPNATDLAPVDSLGLVGTTVADKYEVEAVVGEGGFSVVYRARHRLWNRPVALKCFKSLMDASPSMRESLLQAFVQEGALLTELSARSASIVQARDVGTLVTTAGAWVPYMVLEWLEGRTLESLMAQHPGEAWALDVAVRVLDPVAEALELAHRRNIAHRDVKPGNIFLVGPPPSPTELPPELHVKLLDFGIAKVVQSAAEHGFTKTSAQLTSFTPAYGAPEQFSRARGPTGPWTDVYALALVLGELLAGRPALEGEDFIQLGVSSADPHRRPTPRTLGVDVPDAVEEVLARALALKPLDRYPSAGAMWSELRQALGREPVHLLSVTAKERPATHPSQHTLATASTIATHPQVGLPPPSAPRSSRKLYLALVAAGILGIIGASVAWLHHGPASPATVSNVPSVSASVSAPVSVTPPPEPVPKCPKDMVEVDGGQFFMGTDSRDDDKEDEKPAHNVTLSPFCMDRTEVTVAAYLACSKIGACKRPWTIVDWEDIAQREAKIYSPLCNGNDPEGRKDHPINCVDWQMAVTYCEAVGKRLPTEAEWEFAARGPDGRIYPWGDEAPDQTRLNACGKECVAWGKQVQETWIRAMYPGDDGFVHTAPVGSFPLGASRYGLLDIVGNVWEWTADWKAAYDPERRVDPQGPSSGTLRVVRGGAWNGAFTSWVRPSKRYGFTPETKSHAVGFRCARSQSR